MNHYFKYLFYGLLPLLPAVSYSQISLKGKVTDNGGTPMENARIAADSPLIETFSDAEGDFFFEDLNPGFYLFSVEYPGHSPGYYPIDLERDTLLAEYWVPGIPVQELEGLVITASHHGQKKVETLPAEIVGRTFLRKNAEGSLMQTLSRLPGIESMNIGSSGSKPQIRGLGFNRVAVIENGIKHEGQQWGADHGLEIDQYNAERIEISKGPASFMYGSDAMGGVINIRSVAVPLPHTSGGGVDLSGKSNNLSYGGSVNLYTRRTNWFVNGRLTYMDYADFRVPADTIYSYSYAVDLDRHFVRNTAGREFNQSLSTGYIGGIGQSVFYLGRTFHKSGFFANAHGLEPRNVDEELHDSSNRDIQLPHQQVSHFKLINQSELEAGRHHLAADIGYQRNLRNESGHYVNHGYMPPNYPQTMNFPEDLERKFDKTTVSLHLKDEFSAGHHEFSLGLDGEWQFNKIGGWGFLIPAFGQQNIGGFVYDKYPLSENLGIQGALRYDFGRIRVEEYRDWFESLVDRSGKLEREYLQRAPDFSRRFSSLTWSAGLHYEKDGLGLTLNIGKAFRMPIAKELAANGVNYHYFRYEKGDRNLQPEESYQIDLGIDRNGEKWHFHITPFFNYFSNYIYLNPTADYDTYYGAGNQVFEYTQARVLRAGTEIQVVLPLMRHWNVEATGEYVYNRQMSGVKKNYTLPYTPPLSSLLSLSFEPEAVTPWWSDPYCRLDVRLSAAQNNIVPSEKKTPGYEVWNFSTGGRIKVGRNTADVNISVKNIFNRTYYNHTSFYRLIELPETGRSFDLTVRIPINMKGV